MRRTVRLLDGLVIAYVETANIAYSENAFAKCNELHDSEADLTVSRQLGGSCLRRANGSAQAYYHDLHTVRGRCPQSNGCSRFFNLSTFQATPGRYSEP